LYFCFQVGESVVVLLVVVVVAVVWHCGVAKQRKEKKTLVKQKDNHEVCIS
jgi:hypothetical protein